MIECAMRRMDWRSSGGRVRKFGWAFSVEDLVGESVCCSAMVVGQRSLRNAI